MYYNSDKEKLSYVLIPKCGSTSIQRALESSESNKTDKPKYPSFTVIRNPVNRFFSGHKELIKRELFKGTPQQLLDKIEQDGFFDPHIKPQTHFIGKIDRYYTINQLPFKVPHLNKSKISQGHINMTQFKEIYKEDVLLWEKREGGLSN